MKSSELRSPKGGDEALLHCLYAHHATQLLAISLALTQQFINHKIKFTCDKLFAKKRRHISCAQREEKKNSGYRNIRQTGKKMSYSNVITVIVETITIEHRLENVGKRKVKRTGTFHYKSSFSDKLKLQIFLRLKFHEDSSCGKATKHVWNSDE